MTDRDKKIREKLKEVIKSACQVKKTGGVDFFKVAAWTDGEEFSDEETAFFLSRLTEKVGLTTVEKYNFGSIIVVDLR